MDDINTVAGRVLRRHRIKRAMTQMGLADKIGISYQQVQKYEKGASGMSIVRLVAFAKAFDIKPINLLKQILDEARR